MPFGKTILPVNPNTAFDRIERYNPRVNTLFYDSMAKLFDMYYMESKFLDICHLGRRLDAFIVEGQENIPQNGSFIAAPNHRSHLDHAFVGKPIHDATGRHMNFMAKDGFWTGNLGIICGRIVERGGAFPVKRESDLGIDGQYGVRQHLNKIFRNNEGLIQYPEGTRMRKLPDDTLRDPLKTGVAQNSIYYQSSIIPVGIAGARELDVVSIVFGKQITPPQVEDPTNYSEMRAPAYELTAELRESVLQACRIATELRADRL
ncbi:MAG TPA: lysophospholipid acyltransferase family protein [Candidatus Saccharimonadales bacterium]